MRDDTLWIEYRPNRLLILGFAYCFALFDVILLANTIFAAIPLAAAAIGMAGFFLTARRVLRWVSVGEPPGPHHSEVAAWIDRRLFPD